jgi:plasmid stability protein
MGQIIVRNLDDDVITRLKRRAAERKISLERHVRDVLAEATKPARAEALEKIVALRDSIGAVSGDSTAVIRRMRDRGWSGD